MPMRRLRIALMAAVVCSISLVGSGAASAGDGIEQAMSASVLLWDGGALVDTPWD